MERTVEAVIVSSEGLSRVAAILRRALVAQDGGAATAAIKEALTELRAVDAAVDKTFFALLAPPASPPPDRAGEEETCEHARRGGCSGRLVVKRCRAACGYAARRCVAHGGNVAGCMEGAHFFRKHASAGRPARRASRRTSAAKALKTTTPSIDDALREVRPMVEGEARRLAAKAARGRDVVEDLINEGIAAVLANLHRYDASRGTLAGFFRRRVHGAMCDWLTKSGTAISVAGRARADVESIDAPIRGTDDLRLLDTLADAGASPEEAVLAKEAGRERRRRQRPSE